VAIGIKQTRLTLGGLAGALALPRPRPLVQRGEYAVAPDRPVLPRAAE
jgi:hypothetical protein